MIQAHSLSPSFRSRIDIHFFMTMASLAKSPMNPSDTHVRSSASKRHGSIPSCVCASSLEQVEAAWHLVYQRYSQMGLIDENPYQIHLVPTAVGAQTSVIWGPEGPRVGYTMTLFRDNAGGLALDSIYKQPLDALRREGCNLLEVGMLADNRHQVSRGINALFSMMRWAIYFGLHHAVTDIVVGVHPRHALFYMQCYGFEQIAPPTSYPAVRDHPVVLLRLRLHEAMAREKLPRGLAYARSNPLPISVFSHCFAFKPGQLHGSRIAHFLRERYGVNYQKPSIRH